MKFTFKNNVLSALIILSSLIITTGVVYGLVPHSQVFADDKDSEGKGDLACGNTGGTTQDNTGSTDGGSEGGCTGDSCTGGLTAPLCPDGSTQPSHQECTGNDVSQTCTTVYDACPTVAIPAEPTISASCDTTTHVANISWSAPTGSTYYLLRLNDTAYTWNGTCTGTGNACWNNETGTSRSITGLYGNYLTWVHACNSTGCSAAVSTNFSCTPPVASDPSGTLTATGCTTAAIGGTCAVPVSWSTSNSTFNSPPTYSNTPFSQVNVIDNSTGTYYSPPIQSGRNYIQDLNKASDSYSFQLPKGVYTIYLYGMKQTPAANTYVVVDSKIVTVTDPGQADLISGTIAPTTATAGVSSAFSFNVTNVGAASTGSSFNNFFQIATSVDGSGNAVGGTTDFAANPLPALAAKPSGFMAAVISALSSGVSGVATASHTFPAAGTYYMRGCADKANAADAGTIAEANEGNNCGTWTGITVSAGISNPTVNAVCNPSGTSVGLSWNPVAGATSYYPRLARPATCPSGWSNDGNECYIGDVFARTGGTSATSLTFTPITPNTTYTTWVHAGNSTSADTSVHQTSFSCTAACSVGGSCSSLPNSCGMTNSGTYDASCSCSATAVPDSSCPTLTLNANPARVRSGSSAQLTWSATGSITSCTLTGTNGFSNSSLTGTNVDSGAITAQTIFTLSCSTGIGPKSVSDTVNLIPSFIEI